MKEPKIETSKTVKDTSIPEEKRKYDDIQTTQQAINMAVAERRVVRYITSKTRKEILAQIVDKKGCSLMKPDKDSMEVAIVPEYIKDFDFNAVDTKIIIQPKSPLIWTP